MLDKLKYNNIYMENSIIIEEDENPESYLEDSEVGDTIEIIPNNQEGKIKIYKVILKNGNKTLEILPDREPEIYEGEEEKRYFSDDDDATFVGDNEISLSYREDGTQQINGGKKRYRKRKSRKSKKNKKNKKSRRSKRSRKNEKTRKCVYYLL